MAVYLAAWPDKTWSLFVCNGQRTVEQLCELCGPLDATDNPSQASIFKLKKEGGEFYCDLSSKESEFPLIHWGDLIPVRLVPPYDEIHRRLEAEVGNG